MIVGWFRWCVQSCDIEAAVGMWWTWGWGEIFGPGQNLGGGRPRVGLLSGGERGGGQEGGGGEQATSWPGSIQASGIPASSLRWGSSTSSPHTKPTLATKKNTVQQSVSLGKCLLMTKSHLGPFGSFPFTEQALRQPQDDDAKDDDAVGAKDARRGRRGEEGGERREQGGGQGAGGRSSIMRKVFENVSMPRSVFGSRQ